MFGGEIRTTTLPGGTANRGCRLHEVMIGGAVIFSFVEKMTTMKREIKWAYGERPGNAPQVYHTERRGSTLAIYMEYVDGAGARFEPTDDNAKLLADTIATTATWQRSSLSESILITHAKEAQIFAETARKCGFDDVSLAERIVETVSILAARSQFHPIADAHNDVNFDNIAFSPVHRTMRLVDWGQFSPNLIGADLHHFVPVAMVRPSWRRFVATLFDHYTLAINQVGFELSREDIQFAARYYALIRTISRFGRRRDIGTFKRVVGLHEVATEHLR